MRPINTTIKKHIQKIKDANAQDRLRLASDVQDGLTITKVTKKLGMSQPWNYKWRACYKAEGGCRYYRCDIRRERFTPTKP